MIFVFRVSYFNIFLLPPGADRIWVAGDCNFSLVVVLIFKEKKAIEERTFGQYKSKRCDTK